MWPVELEENGFGSTEQRWMFQWEQQDISGKSELISNRCTTSYFLSRLMHIRQAMHKYYGSSKIILSNHNDSIKTTKHLLNINRKDEHNENNNKNKQPKQLGKKKITDQCSPLVN